MKKFVTAFLLCIVSLVCGAQSFIDSPNYIYGVGMSVYEADADSIALQSFAKSVGVRIKNSTDYTVTDDNGLINRNYIKNTGVSSSIYADGLKKQVKREGITYIVYYYIDKERYVNERMSLYNKYMNAIDSMKVSEHPHAVNLVLGNMYHAYMALDSQLLNAIYPNSTLLKNSLYEEMRDYYGHLGIRDGNSYEYMLSRWPFSNHLLAIRDENNEYLPGFEYMSFDGVWTQPTVFYNMRKERCDKMKGKLTYVDRTDSMFRFIYEELIEGRLVKIPVPDEFYFYSFKFVGYLN